MSKKSFCSDESRAMKKTPVKLENQLLQKAIDSLKSSEEPETEDQCFGKYVGKAISEIGNKKIKLAAKRQIQNAIFDAQMAEMNEETATNYNMGFQEQNMPSQYQSSQHCQFQQPDRQFGMFPSLSRGDSLTERVLTNL